MTSCPNRIDPFRLNTMAHEQESFTAFRVRNDPARQRGTKSSESSTASHRPSPIAHRQRHKEHRLLDLFLEGMGAVLIL